MYVCLSLSLSLHIWSPRLGNGRPSGSGAGAAGSGGRMWTTGGTVKSAGRGGGHETGGGGSGTGIGGSSGFWMADEARRAGTVVWCVINVYIYRERERERDPHPRTFPQHPHPQRHTLHFQKSRFRGFKTSGFPKGRGLEGQAMTLEGQHLKVQIKPIRKDSQISPSVHPINI